MLDMPDSEIKHIADHMGHSLNIHADIYSLQTSLVERAKVAKILVAVENGQLHKLDNPTQMKTVNEEELNVEGNWNVKW